MLSGLSQRRALRLRARLAAPAHALTPSRFRDGIKQNTQGTALVEFALVLPVLITMFLGVYVVSDMISCYRKVSITTRALTDLISRNISPTSGTSGSTVTTYINSAELVLSPFAITNATLQISQLRICDATHAWVVWTQAQKGTTSANSSLTASTVVAIPASMVLTSTSMVPTSPDGSDVCNNTTGSATKTQVGTAGGYLYFGQVAYAYTPAISYGSRVTTVMADQLYMSPRLN